MTAAEIAGLVKANTHTVIAGASGSGKSVIINAMLWALTADSPEKLTIMLVDLKKGIELLDWSRLPHCTGFAREPEEVVPLLDRLIEVMETRYNYCFRHNLKKYDGGAIYLIVDETAETLAVSGVPEKLTTLLRLARAANIHLVLATQAPNRHKGGGLTAEIQQNIGCAIGLHCRSAIESRQVIGQPGCENLPRYGQAIVSDPDGIREIKVPMIPDYLIKARIKQYKGR